MKPFEFVFGFLFKVAGGGWVLVVAGEVALVPVIPSKKSRSRRFS